MSETVIDAAQREAAKAARLHHLRRVISLLLPLAAAGLYAASHFKAQFPALAWVQSFCEAALIGGIADWFAVVALFRNPMGIPFPHTAIVPRNKNRIGLELGRFVEQNFLTPENVAGKFTEKGLARIGLTWLSQPANASHVVDAAGDALPRLLRDLARSDTGHALGNVVGRFLDQVEIAPILARLLDSLSGSEHAKIVVDYIIAQVASTLHKSRPFIKTRFAQQSRLTPFWVDGYLVNRFVDAIVDMAAEVAADPNHELRALVEEELARIATGLRETPDVQIQLRQAQHDVLARLDPATLVQNALLGAGTTNDRLLSPELAAEFAAMLARVCARLADDPALITAIDARLRRLIVQVLTLFGPQFSALIADAVEQWDADTVSRKLEIEVGPDLQYIRLNGMLVGGLAGVALHPLLHILGVQ